MSMKVWAVVALWAVAAGFALAQESPTPGGVEAPPGFVKVAVPWSDDTVTVDKSYAEEHPEQRGLQTTVAANREVLRDHERELCDLDWRVNTLEDETRATPPAAAGSSTPTQSLGGENENAPAKPAEGGGPMNAVAIIGIVAALLVVAAIAAAVVLTVVGGAVAGTMRAQGAQANLATVAGYARDTVQQSPEEVRRATASASTEAGSFSALWERRDTPPATVTANATAQGGGGTPTPPVTPPTPTPPPTPPPAPQLGTPAQRLVVEGILGIALLAQTDDNIDRVILAAAVQQPPTDMDNTGAVQGLVTQLQGQGVLV